MSTCRTRIPISSTSCFNGSMRAKGDSLALEWPQHGNADPEGCPAVETHFRLWKLGERWQMTELKDFVMKQLHAWRLEAENNSWRSSYRTSSLPHVSCSLKRTRVQMAVSWPIGFLKGARGGYILRLRWKGSVKSASMRALDAEEKLGCLRCLWQEI